MILFNILRNNVGHEHDKLICIVKYKLIIQNKIYILRNPSRKL